MSHDGYILAVNPWIYDFTAYDLWLKPLGLLVVCGFLKKYDYEVRLLDCLDRMHPCLKKYTGKIPKSKPDGRGKYISSPVSKPDALKGIPRRYKRYGIPCQLVEEELTAMPRPEVILITSLISFWYPSIVEMTRLLRKIFPDVPVIIGGLYPELFPTRACRDIDPIFIFKNRDWSGLLRVVDSVFKKDRDYLKLQPGFNEPFAPEYSLVYDKRSVPLITSLGCPYRCPFCLTPLRWEKYKHLQVDYVFRQVEQLTEQYGIRHFAFYDDALLWNKAEHIIPFLEKTIASNLRINFHTPNGLFAKEIDPLISRLMYEAGFKTIRLSFESVDEKLQAEMRKVRNEDLSSALQCLEEAGYKRSEIEIYLIVGLPGQTVREIEDGMKFISDLGARIHLSYFSPIPGTPAGDSTIRRFFPPDYDPVMTNKFAFTLWHPQINWEHFEYIREVKKGLNESLS